MKTCSVHGCEDRHFGLGFCNRHYKRFKAHGDPLIDARAQRTPIANRFWPKVSKSDGCWEWTGCRDAKGYGEIGTGGKRGIAYAHRVSYEINNGTIPDGMHVLHKCDNPPCVNPDHLFLGTHTDNMRDMWSKNRGRCDGAGRQGSSNGNHRLTEDQVIEIRKRLSSGGTLRGLAREFCVSHTLIQFIGKETVWKHVQGTGQ